MTIEINTKVRVVANNNKLDPNHYILEGYDGALALLKCIETDRPWSVHKSRIFQPSGNGPSEEEEIMADASERTTKKKPRKKAERVPFDFAAELATMGSGSEHWSKRVKFDHQNIKAEAHVLISGDRQNFRSFNTYDGSIGGKGKKGKVYDLKDYDKKVKDLTNKGYTRVGTPTATPATASA